MKITSTVSDITREDIVDILADATYTTAYWCCALHYDTDEYKKLRQEGDSFEDVIAKMLMHGNSIYFEDNEEEENYELTFNSLKKGIEIAIDNGYVKDIDNIDGEEADCIIQCALFNDVVFG